MTLRLRWAWQTEATGGKESERRADGEDDVCGFHEKIVLERRLIRLQITKCRIRGFTSANVGSDEARGGEHGSTWFRDTGEGAELGGAEVGGADTVEMFQVSVMVVEPEATTETSSHWN